mmetsp:Transcript_23098/g.41241  ORF Transcript_23098/g.41241 Transcript_23098/m.41241 type:complete len:85 (-) Transcript_23098:40-294(-)
MPRQVTSWHGSRFLVGGMGSNQYRIDFVFQEGSIGSTCGESHENGVLCAVLIISADVDRHSALLTHCPIRSIDGDESRGNAGQR